MLAPLPAGPVGGGFTATACPSASALDIAATAFSTAAATLRATSSAPSASAILAIRSLTSASNASSYLRFARSCSPSEVGGMRLTTGLIPDDEDDDDEEEDR